uniref:Somatic embryogenesis receptor kinase 1 isoform X2 n=1 Tax=Rhizophora mucronata TaxID=61149 RepID=A0A2P2J1P8_RHIMU
MVHWWELCHTNHCLKCPQL